MHYDAIEFELRVKFPRSISLASITQQLQAKVKLTQVSDIDVADMQLRSTNKSQQVANVTIQLTLERTFSKAEKSACIDKFCQQALQTDVNEVFLANQLAAA